jgi:hypothetical protein
VQCDTGHPDADHNAQSGQCDAQPQRRPHLRPARGEAALGQDQDQGGEPERLGERGVVEPDAEAGLADRDADSQVEQQRRETEADRHPNG